jgi:cyclic pyranopterin phosphate synthase
MMLSGSTHFDSDGNAHMVDVSSKDVTVREALAAGDVRMSPATAEMIQRGDAKKGDVLGVARLAAIQSAKLTQQLIPLCHAIPIEAVSVDFEWLPKQSPGDQRQSPGDQRQSPGDQRQSPGDQSPATDTAVDDRVTLRCLVRVRTSAKTGVEMEAMTATSIACLTVYDMVKSVDREISIGPLHLLEKSGGKSGHFRRGGP